VERKIRKRIEFMGLFVRRRWGSTHSLIPKEKLVDCKAGDCDHKRLAVWETICTEELIRNGSFVLLSLKRTESLGLVATARDAKRGVEGEPPWENRPLLSTGVAEDGSKRLGGGAVV